MSGIRIMGFHAKKSADGKEYHEGFLGGALVRLFVNEYRKSDKDPDVIMYMSQRPRDDARPQAPPQQRQGAGKITPRPQQVVIPHRITPGTQAAIPTKQEYVDHTQGGYGVDPQSQDVPWPDSDDLPF